MSSSASHPEVHCSHFLVTPSASHPQFTVLPPSLPVVKLGKAVPDDGDGQRNHEHPEDCAETSKYFSKTGNWANISVSYLGHDRDDFC